MGNQEIPVPVVAAVIVVLVGLAGFAIWSKMGPQTVTNGTPANARAIMQQEDANNQAQAQAQKERRLREPQ